jgi:alkanesulfonate monooxygenase SsuD/methylene tetrahydromethanopterin reductase-like flavin-dependent oxidoreductase (luciferase family)
MHFGIFDHLDRYDIPLQEYFESRLKLIEAYDRGGFYCYHVAEHHSTPLGMAPSPTVFMAAIAQRTRQLRIGTLVFPLPLYHPLRLIEEICMLDHMSGGRIDIGFGRGSSPIELAYYGQKPEEAQRIYAEALELIIQGLTEKTLTFKGETFRFENVPMEVAPLQKPYPPIWYGVHAPDSAARAAANGLHTVSLDPVPATKASFDRFREVWKETHRHKPLPKMGLGRFIVVAETDEKALSIARRAYLVWHHSFTYLFKMHGRSQAHPRPPDFDGVIKSGQGIAGSPRTVAEFLKAQVRDTGANYIVGQFAFGDVTLSESLASVDLFTREVMPALR